MWWIPVTSGGGTANYALLMKGTISWNQHRDASWRMTWLMEVPFCLVFDFAEASSRTCAVLAVWYSMFGFSMLSLRCEYIVKCEVVCHQCIWYTRIIESYILLYYILQNMLIMTFTIHASYVRIYIYTIRICKFREFVYSRSNSTYIEVLSYVLGKEDTWTLKFPRACHQ